MPIANYGTWDSLLTSDMLARGNVRYGSLQVDAEGSLYTTELRSFEQGRSAIVRIRRDGTREDLLPAPFSARTRVHEYGGRSVLVHDTEVFFTSQADQQLYRLPLGAAAPRALTQAIDTRFAEPTADSARSRLIAVAERHAPSREPDNFLAQIDLATGAVAPLIEGRSFYAGPVISPDGSALAFLCWDHPYMPWDAAELWLARLGPSGEVTALEHIAGHHEASAMQPTYAPDGTLYFALEADGYWNLHRLGPQGVERVTTRAEELGAPLWALGATHWAFVDARTVAAIHFDRGRARLSLIDVRTGDVRFIAESLPYLGQLAVDGRDVIVATGWSGASSELVRVSIDSGVTRTLVNAHAGLLEEADVSPPEAVEFPTSHGETAHGFFYAPRNQRFTAPAGTLPPLIVVVHGGPTASTSTAFSPTVQFFTTRGFAVLDVNYRGSSGYGRRYRDRLRGEWGVLDVDDCLAGARYLAALGRVDGTRLLIRGGSAGGYTVLRAVEGDSVFAAGACHYGISDLEALTRDTHKFESHYDRFLVGPYPERKDLFVERSPIHHVERISKPVVFFQGLDDKVVPANQTERMATALRTKRIPAEYHAYEGEQHGFRKAETIRHVLETELAFFRRVLKL